MKPKPKNQADLPKNSIGSGQATRSQVRARARKIALANGRSWQEASESDFAQARRQLTGIDFKTASLEAAPESERWNPLPGSTGHKAPTNVSVEEDDGGRSANQQLIDESVAKTEFDQMLQVGKAAAKNS